MHFGLDVRDAAGRVSYLYLASLTPSGSRAACRKAVHLARLAHADGTTAQQLCAALAVKTGYRVATIDTILWRACVAGILDSVRYERFGWRRAFLRDGAPKS